MDQGIMDTLFEIFDGWKKETSNPIEVWYDPTLIKFKRYGMYFFYENEDSGRIVAKSIDWIIEDGCPTTHDILKELVEHYDGEILAYKSELFPSQDEDTIKGIKI